MTANNDNAGQIRSARPSRSRTGTAASVVYLERVILTLTSLGVSALLARTLTESGYGLYKLVGSVLLIATYLLSFGLESTVTRFVPAFRADDEPGLINRLLGGAVLVRTAGLLGFSALLVLGGEKFGNWLNVVSLFQELLPLLIAYISLSLLSRVFGHAFLTGYSRRDLAGWVRIASRVLLLVLVAYIALSGQGVRAVLIVLAVSAGAEAAFYLPFCLSRVLRNQKRARSRPTDARLPTGRLRSFGLYNWLWQSGQLLREYSVDHLVITYFTSPVQVAFYGVAVAIPEFMRSFTPGRMLHGVILPELVERYEATGSLEPLRRAYVLLQKLNLFLLLPVVVGFLYFAPEALQLVFGSRYAASGDTARILVAFGVFNSLAYPFYTLTQAIERPEYIFYSTAFALYNLGADILLIPAFGIEGAAVATGSASMGIFLYFVWIYKTRIGLSLTLPWSTVRRLSLNLLPTLVLFAAAKWLGLFSLAGFSIALLGVGAYPTMCSMRKIFARAERELLHAHLPVSRRVPFV